MCSRTEYIQLSRKDRIHYRTCTVDSPEGQFPLRITVQCDSTLRVTQTVTLSKSISTIMGLIMVWAEMALVIRTGLFVFASGGITESRHRSDILELIVRPYTGAIGDAFILMENNARAHTARVYMTFLDDKCIDAMN